MRIVVLLVSVLVWGAMPANAQDEPSAPEPTYPVISLGTVTYVQYAVDLHDPAHFNAFDLTRSYIHFNADLTRRISFRLTPDIRRASGGPLDGSLVLRLKFGYVDFDGPTPGSWVRAGLHQTPWLDFAEGVNRYRVQSQMFAEREGLIPGSSDFGIGYFARLADQRLEVQGGVYNGEGFGRGEVDSGKSIQGRLTVRPWGGRLSGLRLSAFGDWGAPTAAPPRRHAIAMMSYESARAVVTIEGLRSTRPLNGIATRSTGVSGFGEIRRSVVGPAAFVRVERMAASDGARRRAILGLAYWLKWDRVRLGFVASLDGARSTLPSTPERERQFAAQTHVQF